MSLKKSGTDSLNFATEAELLSFCGAALQRSGVLWWRNPVQASIYTRNGKTFMRPSPIKGFPDLSFIGIDGRLYCAELKTKKGRLSIEQEQWLEDLNLAGAVAKVIRSGQEMMELIAMSRNCMMRSNN